MKIRHMRSLEEFQRHISLSSGEEQSIRDLEDSYQSSSKKVFTVRGFSYPAGKEVDFLVDYQSSVGGVINWRERLICPVTQLNNRLRASIHLMDIELAPYSSDRIYISEQVTPLYTYLKQRYPNLVGSEFLGSILAPGAVNSNGVRHEDMTRLSFETSSIDCILSFDCFEHFPDFTIAFAECARVLKPRGKMLWSVPFVVSSANNIIRARIEDGKIDHILPPEYHGDPVNSEGCLCFTHFGWEMLAQVREAGFRDAYAVPYRSREFGYLGAGQLVFVAEK